ncbi:MAG: TauD/TfdA family dioxygenase [Gammaproteobacteria bacterium]|nr:TauD/TfdA family dioxygenase [Gammaproteobacteria bacterium]MDH3576994.1 TauD/TfdA family dioxygenase [Gammaproteobacteria bacterium]
MYCCAESSGTDRFINSEAAYVALPTKLKARIDGLHLRWLPCSEMHIDAVVNNDGSLSCPRESAHVVTGAQFINLLLHRECRILDSNDASADEILIELREHVLQEKFCYSHECMDGDLIAWNPRRVLHMPSPTSTNTPRFVYPRELSGTQLDY